MSTRYLTGATIALLGGFEVVASRSFQPSVTAWLAFAVAIAVIVILAAAQRDVTRGAVQQTLDGLTVLLAGWTIVASLVYSGSLVQWLSFAEALGFVALGMAGTTLHEIDVWRRLHGLPGTPGHARSDRTLEAA